MSSSNVAKGQFKTSRRRSSLKILESLQNHLNSDAISNPTSIQDEAKLGSTKHIKRQSRRKSSIEMLEAIEADCNGGNALTCIAKDVLVGKSRILDSPEAVTKKFKENYIFSNQYDENVAHNWTDAIPSSKSGKEKENFEVARAKKCKHLDSYFSSWHCQTHNKKDDESNTLYDPEALSTVTPRNQIVGGAPSSPPPMQTLMGSKVLPHCESHFTLTDAQKAECSTQILFESDKVCDSKGFAFDCTRSSEVLSCNEESDCEVDNVTLDDSFSNEDATKPVFVDASLDIESPMKAGDLDNIFRTCSLDDATTNGRSGAQQSESLHNSRQQKNEIHPLPPSNANYQSGLRPNLALPDL